MPTPARPIDLRPPGDVRIQINDADLPPEAAADLNAVHVHDDLEAPGMFSFELRNWDPSTLGFPWSDHTLFNPGNQVELWLGYVDELQSVMRAEITSLEPSFGADTAPTLTVRGYDHRHRLLRGTRTRSFAKMKDSDIARQIARDAGLGAQVTDSKIAHDYVLQSNVSDLGFLQQRATRIGYDVFVRDKVLHFEPRRNDAKPALSLTLTDLIEFQPRLTTLTQVGEVAVHGWDVKQKKALRGRARSGMESSLMAGDRSGPKRTSAAFGASAALRVADGALTQGEADQIAKGLFNAMALTYISGEAVCMGRADLQAGTVVKIEGVGKTFSGLYFIDSVSHEVTSDSGYTTRFSVRRNAS
jgi:phage protein D